VPRLSEQTRATRRHHILTSAWICFSRNGFQATSMDEVIAQTGMSSSAVYRYFRGKDELIDATAEAGLTRIRDIFAGALESRPIATPSDMLDILVSDLRAQTSTPEYDITRIAIQSWAEALRRPPLRQRTRQLYREAREQLVALAVRWQAEGLLPEDASPRATATVLFAMMPGLLINHHLVDTISLEDLSRGLTGLARAIASPRVIENSHSRRT